MTCKECKGRGKVVYSAPYLALESGWLYSHTETLCGACGGTGLRPQEAARTIIGKLCEVLGEDGKR